MTTTKSAPPGGLSSALRILDVAQLHLPLEMSGYEYRELEEALPDAAFGLTFTPNFQKVLETGKRNLTWLDAVNRQRQAPLELMPLEEIRGFPADAPHIYNEALITASFKDFVTKAPPAYIAVVTRDVAIPAVHRLTNDQEFIETVRKMDLLYRDAVRWKALSTELGQYKLRAGLDMRGYFALQKVANLRTELAAWATVDKARQQQLAQWLVSMCRDFNVPLQGCEQELWDEIRQSGHPLAYYDKHLVNAKEKFTSMFKVRNARVEDGKIAGPDASQLTFRFIRPEDPRLADWFEASAENVWRLDDWRLDIKFVSPTDLPTAPQLVLQSGILANANALGGDKIHMDGQRTSSALDRVVAAHELGHILGFTDCYVEFYDEDAEQMVSYQLDLDNIMCSNRGRVLPQHVSRLKQAYRPVGVPCAARDNCHAGWVENACASGQATARYNTGNCINGQPGAPCFIETRSCDDDDLQAPP